MRGWTTELDKIRHQGFTIRRILTQGKMIEVEFDNPILVTNDEIIRQSYIIPESKKFRILQYRSPGIWRFKGVSEPDMEGYISMGEKLTSSKDGIF